MNAVAYSCIFLDNLPWRARHSTQLTWEKCTVQPAHPRSQYRLKKHPSVGQGKGFWETDDTIVVGYVLARDARVFRPVFQFMRNKHLQGVINMVKDRIGNNQGSFMTRLRRNLYRRAMLGLPLPVSTILYIGNFL